MKKILIIEDEADIAEVVRYNLKREGFEAEIAATVQAGLKSLQGVRPDLIYLDLMLPDKNGLDFCRELKGAEKYKEIPIIMVTAMGDEADIVRGLEIGADDYVSKPFSPKELIARVKSVLRRYGNLTDALRKKDRIQIEGLVIDVTSHKVLIDGKEVAFTATEFRLLKFLASYPGRVFTRDVLIDRGVGEGVVVVDRNIDVHIQMIRKKMESHRHLIETIRGIGYRFKESHV